MVPDTFAKDYKETVSISMEPHIREWLDQRVEDLKRKNPSSKINRSVIINKILSNYIASEPDV